jgi:hypothetical protein
MFKIIWQDLDNLALMTLIPWQNQKEGDQVTKPSTRSRKEYETKFSMIGK